MEGDEAMLFPAGSFRWKLERLDMEITQKNIGSKDNVIVARRDCMSSHS
jgi:hypothetical protein